METHLCVRWKWREGELWTVHEDGTVPSIVIVQQRRERLVKADITRYIAVAWRTRGRHAQRHPAVGGCALLTAHAVAAAAEPTVGHRANDQGELQDQLLTAWNVHVDLKS